MADNNAQMLGQLVGKTIRDIPANLQASGRENREAHIAMMAPAQNWVQSNIMQPVANFAGGVGQGLMGQSAEQGQKAEGKKAATPSARPSDAPDKYVLDLLLQSVTPSIIQLGQQAFAETGLVPDPRAILGNLVGYSAGPQAPQPGQMAPAAQTPQPGQAAPTAQAPQQEQMAPAAQAQAPATPKGQILPAKGLFTKQGYDPETNTVQLGGMFDFAGQPLKNIATAQEIIGEKKWQKGDKEKTKFEAGKDIKLKHMELETELAKTNAATALENEKHARTVLDKIAEPITLSGEALDKKAGITEITDNAQKLLARLKGDPSTLRTLGLPGDEKGQETLLWANTIKTRSKFMTGGKALTAIENKLIDQISTSTGLKAFLQNPGTQMKILEGILEKTKGYQRELDPYMEERNFLNKARASGKYSDAEILSMLHVKRGRKTDAKAK